MKGINNTSQISLTPYKSPVFLTEIHDRSEADTVHPEIFAYRIKRHICDAKNSRRGHDLPL